MLVLSRKTEERIQIGPDITITILQVKGRTVRIGIEAPRETRVLRAELPALPSDANPPQPLRRTRPRRQAFRNPGERVFVASQPLAAKLQARRAPGLSTRTLIG